MKFHAILCSALFAGANAVSAQAEVTARVWMLDHPSGDQDDLAELKTENPDAYALVKALLTKRSLGLLDPKHPTASFAAPPPKTDDDAPKGAEVYAKFATTEKEQLALQGATSNVPYPDAPAQTQAAVPYPEASGASHDWMNWKPGQDDESMVKSVLGAVADLTGKKKLRGSQDDTSDDSSPLAAEVASEAAAPVAEATPAPTTTVAVADVQPQQNPYSEMLGAQPAKQEKPAPSQDTGSALSSFSFDDTPSTTTTTTIAAKSAGGANPLGAWLGMVKPHVQTKPAPAEAEKPANPYLMDLQ